jgi:hypothetical protein
MRASVAAVLLLLCAVPALAKPPVWDRRIDSPKRFKVLAAFDGAAVLDQETGLVWAREVQLAASNWVGAFLDCSASTIGGRGGWRLPTVHEFKSLVSSQTQALPEGHPFTAPDGLYWTSTSVPDAASTAFVGDLGNPLSISNADTKSIPHPAWCVRGGVGATVDAY